MVGRFKQEVTICKIDLLSRKIASLAVKRIPEELIAPEKKNLRKNTIKLTDELTEAITGIVGTHHEEITDYLSEDLVKSNVVEVSYRRNRYGDAQITPERLSAYLKAILGKWRNNPS